MDGSATQRRLECMYHRSTNLPGAAVLSIFTSLDRLTAGLPVRIKPEQEHALLLTKIIRVMAEYVQREWFPWRGCQGLTRNKYFGIVASRSLDHPRLPAFTSRLHRRLFAWHSVSLAYTKSVMNNPKTLVLDTIRLISHDG
jgi:hypothetical protein